MLLKLLHDFEPFHYQHPNYIPLCRYFEQSLAHMSGFSLSNSRYASFITPRLRIKGLPYTTTMEDIFTFFDDCEINSERIPTFELLKDPSGRFNGQAYVYFKDQYTLENTLIKKRNCFFKGKRINLFVDNQDYLKTGSNKPLITKLDRARFPKDNR